jgi:hypothetical protein
VLQRIDDDAPTSDHHLGVGRLDVQDRAVLVVLDVDVRRDAHPLEQTKQKLARLFGEIFTIGSLGHTASY